MIRLLTLFLELVNRIFSDWEASRHREVGRQQTIKEINDEINRQVELGEAAISIPDPERDERLRSRFDRSKNGQ